MPQISDSSTSTTAQSAASLATTISSIDALEAALGKPTYRAGLKVIDHIDAGAAHWITVSPLAFLSFCGGSQAPTSSLVTLTLAGGGPGFVTCPDTKRLSIPVASVDAPHWASVGSRFGSLFLAPDIGETLRLNGRVVAIDDQALSIEIDECYVHCAKSLIRSAFWKATPQSSVALEPDAFALASSFMVLASYDGGESADVSPKGDPAGSMIRLDQGRLTFAERPGNRRTDSLRNIIKQPNVAALALIPGTDQVAVMTGEAQISTDESVRAAWVVAGKMPLLTTSITVRDAKVQRSAALARAALWPVKRPVDAPDPAKLLVQHISSHGDKSKEADEIRTLLAVPGAIEKSLAESYRNNLY